MLSTLHCNESVDAIQRLADLGLSLNSIQSELLGIFAQRLARRLCPECRSVKPAAADLLAEVFPSGGADGFVCYEAGGCAACEGTGSVGRVAVVEYLAVDAVLRSAMSRRAGIDELRAVAIECGLRPMRDYAIELARSGTIAFEELRQMFSPAQLRPAGPHQLISHP